MAITAVAGAGEPVSFSKEATSYKLKKPAGVEADDILITGVVVGGKPTFTTPGDWTLIASTEMGSEVAIALYWMRYTSGTEWEAKWSAKNFFGAWVEAYRGCVTSGSPIDVSSGGKKKFSEGEPTETITLKEAGEMVVAIACLNEEGKWTVASGFTSRSSQESWLFSDKLFTGSGSTGAVKPTAPAHDSTDEWSQELIALLPAGGEVIEGPPVTLAAHASAAGVGSQRMNGAGALTAAASSDGEGSVRFNGAGSMAAAAALAGSGVLRLNGAASFAALASLTGDGITRHNGGADLGASGAWSGSGFARYAGGGALLAAGNVAGHGVTRFNGSGSLAATAAMTGTGTVGFTGSGRMSASAEWSGSGTVRFNTVGHMSARATWTYHSAAPPPLERPTLLILLPRGTGLAVAARSTALTLAARGAGVNLPARGSGVELPDRATTLDLADRDASLVLSPRETSVSTK
ncbi:MAG TPA: hypothetical protein VGF95_14405 [Solirubrobacteraceae bacterium]|jgi:hypothetical protein